MFFDRAGVQAQVHLKVRERGVQDQHSLTQLEETKPAQSVASPGRLSVASWIGREIVGLSQHRDPALASQLRALSGHASVLIDTIPPSEIYRRMTLEEARQHCLALCEDVVIAES